MVTYCNTAISEIYIFGTNILLVHLKRKIWWINESQTLLCIHKYINVLEEEVLPKLLENNQTYQCFPLIYLMCSMAFID